MKGQREAPDEGRGTDGAWYAYMDWANHPVKGILTGANGLNVLITLKQMGCPSVHRMLARGEE
jgi:hypothetical protein